MRTLSCPSVTLISSVCMKLCHPESDTDWATIFQDKDKRKGAECGAVGSKNTAGSGQEEGGTEGRCRYYCGLLTTFRSDRRDEASLPCWRWWRLFLSGGREGRRWGGQAGPGRGGAGQVSSQPSLGVTAGRSARTEGWAGADQLWPVKTVRVLQSYRASQTLTLRHRPALSALYY